MSRVSPFGSGARRAAPPGPPPAPAAGISWLVLANILLAVAVSLLAHHSPALLLILPGVILAALLLKAPVPAFLFYVAVIPLATVVHPPGYSWLSITKISFALSAGAFLLAGGGRRLLDTRSNLAVPILLILLAGGLSLFGSEQVGKSAVALLSLTGMALLYFLCINVILDARSLARLMRVLVCSCCVLSLLGIYQSISGKTLLDIGIYPPYGGFVIIPVQGVFRTHLVARASGTFNHPIDLGAYLVAVLPPATAYLAYSRKKSRAALLPAAFVVLGAVAIVLTFTRSAWLGALAALAVVAFHKLKSVKYFIAGFLVLAAAVLMIPEEHREALLSRATRAQSYDIERFCLWKASWDMIQTHPLTGIGLGNFPFKYLEFRPPEAPIEKVNPLVSHNMFLSLWAEAGPLGLTAFLFLVIRAWRNYRQACRDGRGTLTGNVAIGAFAGFAGFLVMGLLNSLEYQEVFWILIALSWVLQDLRQQALAVR